MRIKKRHALEDLNSPVAHLLEQVAQGRVKRNDRQCSDDETQCKRMNSIDEMGTRPIVGESQNGHCDHGREKRILQITKIFMHLPAFVVLRSTDRTRAHEFLSPHPSNSF